MKNIIAVETAKSVDEACAALEKAVAAHHFGILHVHNVRQTLANKGVALDREVRIFDVCNPQRAKQVLEANPLAATALPCAIAVFVEHEKTTLAFIRPTAMLGLFGSEDLKPVAEEVERTVQEIVEAAAR
jgi:uncharacterized protein (DUF302 family)